MRITCFFMVCAYLSATVFTEEIKHLNRIKRVKSREEFAPKNGAAAGKESSSPTTEGYFDVFARKFSTRVETFQKPKKILPEIQFESLQQQHYKRTGRPVKRLKIRSVGGISEVNGNELISNLIPEVHDHGHGSIHIEPVFRVTTRSNNVFESIIDILRQLLDPPKNELGPLVGPVQMPGSGRKIYLRLLEPVDTSHVMVRFVTQVQVPTVDQEAKHSPIFSSLPVIDPAAVLLNGHHSGPSDAVFGSSSRHHNSVHPPRNARGKGGRGSQSNKQTVQSSTKNLSKAPQDSKVVAEEASPDKEESSKDTQTNQALPGGSYYHFETEEEALNQMNAILGEVNATTINESQEHQLATHRLPLRQITPLYPLTSMTHAEPSADTYKVPSDVLTGPSSGSYEQYYYGDANSAPGFYASSYDQHYSAPSSHAASYYQPSNVHSTPTTYATAATYQNEFHPAASYQSQNEFGNSYSTASSLDDKQNDLYGAPSSYSASYERPADVPPLSGTTYATFYEKPNGAPTTSTHMTSTYANQHRQGAQSGDALHIIDPPYFPGYMSKHTNRSYDLAAIRQHQSRYNLHSPGGTDFAQSPLEKIVWGKSRGQKSETGESGSFPRDNPSEAPSKNGHEKWQPVLLVDENAGWRDAFKTDLATKHQSSDRPRKTSSPERLPTIDQRQNSGKRRGSTFRSSWCLTGEEDGCHQTKSTTASTDQVIHLEKVATGSILVAEKTQPQETVKLIPASNLPANSTIETSTSVVTSKSPTTSSTTSTTKLPPLLVDTTKSSVAMIEKPLPLVQTTGSPEVSIIGTTKKSIASETRNKLVIKVEDKPIKQSIQPTTVSSTTKSPVSNGNARKLDLPKRPMIMKKPMFIMKRMELSTTPKNPTTSSTVKNAIKFSKFRSTRKPTT